MTARPEPVAGLTLLGFRIDDPGLAGTIDAVDSFVASSSPHQIITANALMLLAASETPALAAAFRAASLVLPDSAGVTLAARLGGRRLRETLPGVELIGHLCRRAAERGWRVFLLGAAPGVAAAAAEALRRQHPGLTVVGARHGYFSAAEEPEVLREVSAAAPDLIFVALSVPRQDIWIRENLPRLGCKAAMGVGGSFDVLSGRLRRAPRWMRTAGLEWLFRLAQEPWRAGRMARLPVFLARAIAAARVGRTPIVRGDRPR